MPVAPRCFGLRPRWATAATVIHLLALSGADAAPARREIAAPARRDIHGIGLGMTAAKLVAVPGIHCAVNKTKDVSCEDHGDGSEYKVLMSGADPSVALSVKQTFCSAQRMPAVLAMLLKTYGLRPPSAHPNPNGASFDISDTVTGNLNGKGGPCAKGGTTYQFTISDSSLLMMQGVPTGASDTQTEGLAKRPPATP